MDFHTLSRKAVIPCGVAVWLIAVGLGFRHLAAYSLRPGTSSAVPRSAPAAASDWPPGLPFYPRSGGTTLVVTLHPECPCSRATLAELERIVTREPDLQPVAIFEGYDTLPEPLAESRLWKQAAAIPGAKVLADRDGSMAAALGARTSGEVRVYSAGGQLLYQGGITASRGHEGANPASDAVIALVTGVSATPVAEQPVFGCALDR